MLYVNYILIKLGFDGEKETNGTWGQDTMQMEKKCNSFREGWCKQMGDWGLRTISPLCKTHTFQYQLPILTLLMAVETIPMWNHNLAIIIGFTST